MTNRLSIQVEPTAPGKLFYLPLAPTAQGATERLKIGLSLLITNITDQTPNPETVTVTGIDFTFPGSAIGTQPMEGVGLAIEPVGGRIEPGATSQWTNGRVILSNGDAVHNEVYLDAPAPPQIRVNVHCRGFSEFVTMDLVRYSDPTGDGAFLFPFAGEDLDEGEYVVAEAVHKYRGGPSGSQIFAHDMFIQSQAQGDWSSYYDLRNKDDNEDVRIFGKPVRAMADGVVFGVDTGVNHGFPRGYPDNPLGADDRPEGVPVGGNHLWVTHGNAEVEYCHLRRGSIRVANGDRVVAGQKLGEAGNSGNTSGTPHLHIQSRDTATNSLRPFTFRHAIMVERSQLAANGTGPWVRMYNRGVCKPKAAILPHHPEGDLHPQRPSDLRPVDPNRLRIRKRNV
jgi:murein DD-endopeptidase MepM/ murein hydrolase activator NlpD